MLEFAEILTRSAVHTAINEFVARDPVFFRSGCSLLKDKGARLGWTGIMSTF